jgi:hypothetical protein
MTLVTPAAKAEGGDQGHVDPRYPFTIDASGTFGYLSTLASFGASVFATGGDVDFGFPVGERRQVVIAAHALTGQTGTSKALTFGASAGYRMMTFADPWRTRLDFQLAGDWARFQVNQTPDSPQRVSSGFGVGVRLAAGAQYWFLPWLGAGAEVSIGAYVPQLHFLLAIGPTLTANW